MGGGGGEEVLGGCHQLLAEVPLPASGRPGKGLPHSAENGRPQRKRLPASGSQACLTLYRGWGRPCREASNAMFPGKEKACLLQCLCPASCLQI